MYADISPSEPRVPARDAELNRSDGRVHVGFASTGLATLYQRSPGRVLFPHVERGDIDQAVLLNTAGGLTGGDRWSAELDVADGARALFTTQAAERIYRALDDDARVETRFSVGAGAWAEWLPQETIVFEGARLRRRLEIDLAAEARLLAVESLVFGRLASGERITRGLLHDSWRVRRAGRLVWADTLYLEDDIAAVMARGATFAGARAMASVLLAVPDAERHLDGVREIVGEAGGAGLVSGLLLCRLLDSDPAAMKRRLTALIARLRRDAGGLPARLPRVWNC